MKRIFTLFTLFIPLLVLSQSPTEFALSKDGLTQFVVTPVDNKTKEEIYSKTLEWVYKSFNEPKEVIKATVDNDYIRIESIAPSVYSTKFMGSIQYTDLKYQIEITVKDNRYKFEVINVEIYMSPQSGMPGWHPLFTDVNLNFWYKKDGTLKPRFEDMENKIPSHFNKINEEIKNYIESKTDNNLDW